MWYSSTTVIFDAGAPRAAATIRRGAKIGRSLILLARRGWDAERLVLILLILILFLQRKEQEAARPFERERG